MGLGAETRGFWKMPWRLASAPQFLSYDSADCRFQRFASTCDVLKERIIDQRLIVSAAGLIDLLAEPIQDFVVEAYGNPRFPGRSGNHRPPFCLREVVFTLHKPSAYSFRSPGVAGRAEMIRTLLSRHV